MTDDAMTQGEQSEVREFAVTTVLQEHQVRQHLGNAKLKWEAINPGTHGDHHRSKCMVSVCGSSRALWAFRVEVTQQQWAELQRWLRSIAAVDRQVVF